ncbi:hypothetical protein HU200_005203 [Digitaria exilis]|uniref:F-box domain-containing protein n=1 Tax=Digitaria exilis TaxID=1010633 RepID=A0A835KUB6_9POAL|nr:hypothetical protein HU200_005203 [Digitaria exilis]
MAPPRSPPPLIDDAIAKILLRLPPDEPEHLFRAALVCKPWLRILCDAGFRRRYRAFHGAPPLLGLLHQRQVMEGDPPRPWDLVWDPVTGDRHTVPEPDIDWLIYSAAVFCATDGCDHLDCHGGPFGIVFMATDDHDELVKATAYSSETGVWTTPVRLDESYEPYAQHRREALVGGRFHYTPYVLPRRGAVIGDEICFTLRTGHAIVKYNLRSNCLSMINPPEHMAYGLTLMVMDDCSLGFACIENSSLYLWSTKVVGSAEGVGVIFISSDAGLFTIELKSGRVRKVEEPGVYFSVLPYMSFYAPGIVIALACLSTASVGFLNAMVLFVNSLS